MADEINPDDLNPHQSALREAIFKRLKPSWRIALLRRKEGFTMSEIAREIGVSKGHASNIIDRGERRLRQACADPSRNPWGYWRARGLSTRTANCLVNDGIRSIEDLRLVSDDRLMRIPNFGRRCLEEIYLLMGAPTPYRTTHLKEG